jgi:hypothetical protein
VIAPDGKHATGATSKVDDKFWHVLTYKRKWYIDGEGYARSGKALHKTVMLHRRQFESGDASIDHIDPTASWTTGRSNRTLNAEQQRNKAPRTAGPVSTSAYPRLGTVGGRVFPHDE